MGAGRWAGLAPGRGPRARPEGGGLGPRARRVIGSDPRPACQFRARGRAGAGGAQGSGRGRGLPGASRPAP